MILGNYRNQIRELSNIPASRYESILRMYTTPDNQYYYNLIQSISINGNIDKTKVFYMPVKQSLPWSIISYNAYGTTELWWLIALINNINNPVKMPEVGTVLKFIRPDYVNGVIDEISNTIR